MEKKINLFVESNFKGIKILDDHRPMELLLNDYAPEVIASYFSATLTHVNDTGIQPLYLYHLIPELSNQVIFKQATILLSSWNYNFVASWNDIHTGYRANMPLSKNQLSITMLTLVNRP